MVKNKQVVDLTNLIEKYFWGGGDFWSQFFRGSKKGGVGVVKGGVLSFKGSKKARRG